MIRTFYRGLLSLHPAAFRDRYGEEFLWIFDAKYAEGSAGAALFCDCLSSLLRQRLLRSGVWKYVVSVLINVLFFHKMIWFSLGLDHLFR